MFVVNLAVKDVCNEFAFVDNWIDTLCDKILNKRRDECKISISYYYGYFVSKNSKQNNPFLLNYTDRVNLELSKIRVTVVIKINDIIFSNKLNKNIIPKIISDIVSEITKYKMIIEFKYHKNKSIKDSIPEFDTSILEVEFIEEFKENPENYDIDMILDKINKDGVNSLTQEEINFLNKKSQEL